LTDTIKRSQKEENVVLLLSTKTKKMPALLQAVNKIKK